MPQHLVCILDYGSGNVRSVFNMFQHLATPVIVSNDPTVMRKASHLVLPGVGAFGASMDKINSKISIPDLEEEVHHKKKPFLGICVGMQVLGTTGYEFGIHKGLNWIPGKVDKIDPLDLPLPHIGWNSVEVKKPSLLLANFPENSDFYFVHSFALAPDDESTITATTSYGNNFCSVIQKDNIYGVQFHPEKSQKAGMVLLENFLKL